MLICTFVAFSWPWERVCVLVCLCMCMLMYFFYNIIYTLSVYKIPFSLFDLDCIIYLIILYPHRCRLPFSPPHHRRHHHTHHNNCHTMFSERFKRHRFVLNSVLKYFVSLWSTCSRHALIFDTPVSIHVEPRGVAPPDKPLCHQPSSHTSSTSSKREAVINLVTTSYL